MILDEETLEQLGFQSSYDRAIEELQQKLEKLERLERIRQQEKDELRRAVKAANREIDGRHRARDRAEMSRAYWARREAKEAELKATKERSHDSAQPEAAHRNS